MPAEAKSVPAAPPPPQPAPAEAHLVAWECAQCGRTSFPARGYCPSCWSENGRRRGLPPEGEVHSHTTVHVGAPGTELPYTVAYVDLGPVRVFARVRGEARTGARGPVGVLEPPAAPAGPPHYVIDLEGAPTDHG